MGCWPFTLRRLNFSRISSSPSPVILPSLIPLTPFSSCCRSSPLASPHLSFTPPAPTFLWAPADARGATAFGRRRATKGKSQTASSGRFCSQCFLLYDLKTLCDPGRVTKGREEKKKTMLFPRSESQIGARKRRGGKNPA